MTSEIGSLLLSSRGQGWRIPSSLIQSHGIQGNLNLKKKTRQGRGRCVSGRSCRSLGCDGFGEGRGATVGNHPRRIKGRARSSQCLASSRRMCVSSCPTGFFGDKAARRCRRCYKGCESCVGRGPGQCTACKRSLYHHPEMGACLPLCPPGFYAEERKGACKPLVNHRGVLTLFAGGENPSAALCWLWDSPDLLPLRTEGAKCGHSELLIRGSCY